MSGVTEAAFEAHIAGWLVEHGGYRRAKIGNTGVGPRDFDAEAGVDTADLFEFIGATQGIEWGRLVDSAYGGDADRAQAGFVQRLASELDRRGTVDVLRQWGGGSQLHHPVGVLQAGSWADAGVGAAL